MDCCKLLFEIYRIPSLKYFNEVEGAVVATKLKPSQGSSPLLELPLKLWHLLADVGGRLGSRGPFGSCEGRAVVI